ncbi:hypothetical protein N658DRAFT_488070 [Parathielavia hyrcaniae]|uniref:Uncharacterized protein n=1 Tax=Parathielavia hyrcaniae TaxID=113614 RepID=A0AAN6SZV6_9PEZI|nr:hypothetical protein N658DRAFT_488070 [Parathielavia hyrcaniae]
MAPRQNTFTLVPNPLGMQGLVSRPTSGPESKPPMTSKQAQKMHKQATRGPRLSKAEQRRIELEEQARIRKELEKDKQANKARILREKKKAKEQQMLEEKKRKGLPLVQVRPSQDTIARFVRGNGLGKKRDAAGAMVGLSVLEEEGESDNALPKDSEDARETKRRLGEQGTWEMSTDTGAVSETESAPPPRARELREQTYVDPTPPKLVRAMPDITELPHETKPTEPVERSTSRKTMSPISMVSAGGRTTIAKQSFVREPRKMAKPEPNPEPEDNQGCDGKPTPVDGAEEDKAITAAKSVRPCNAHRASEDTLAKSSHRETPRFPSIRHATPERGVLDREKTSAAHISPVLPKLLPKLERTPITKEVQALRPLPTSRLPPNRPPQRHPSPKPQLPPNPAARKPLQETTDASNRTQPLPVGDPGPKFTTPHKQTTFATPRPQTRGAVPAFKQPRSETPTSRVQKPQFLPPHLRGTGVSQRTPSPASTRRNQAQTNSISAPPTSTQLFVMSHLDDVFPSPSQEARELQGDFQVAVPESRKPGPLRTPIVGHDSKDARPARQWRQKGAHPTLPMAPAPQPATAKQPAVNPPDIPFISTQDLIFSSQELRDVEAPTPSKNKTFSTEMAPFKKPRHAVQQRPSPPSHVSSHARTAPRIRPNQSTLGAIRQPPQACGPKNCALDEQRSSHWGRQTPQSSKPASPSCADSMKVDGKISSDKPPRPASPEKPRFFSSSGSGACLEVLLARERSRKTYEEEEWRRLAQLRAEPSPADDNSGSAERSRGSRKANPQSNRCGPAQRQQGEAPQAVNNNPRLASQDRAATAGQPDTATNMASQETDYGDLELDSMDFEELDRVLEDRDAGSQGSCEDDDPHSFENRARHLMMDL